MSKNALKKQAKLEKKNKERAEKEAKRAAEITVKENELDPTAYFQNRSAFVLGQKAEGLNPYPHKFQTTILLTDFIEKYAGLAKGERLENEVVSVAGRLMPIRPHGKLNFYDLQADGLTIQIMADEGSHKEGDFRDVHSRLRRGDIVGITGIHAAPLRRTRTASYQPSHTPSRY